ncbi:cysteine desulfurase family protein [Gemella sp. zg-1178]|uniref:cysteine desulfurase family protein n=1 Tax=Gemella sp. zg-1178 TaxID=2840372 RepID=UPI001C05993C|nr:MULTISPECIES: cysteine desulfurase family protein [unclassified Gemella]MBU0278046.1 cysteine desulfurase [Gemella sp. zg-1178]QWQ38425.1 cysteine desulfurase [Gemella sp. zg-570]
MNNIYLDYAASSLKHFDIYKKMIDILENEYANPSSPHKLGKKNAKLLEEARKKIATSINASSEKIIFTSGGTEANNMVFNHVAKEFSGGDIIISSVEHPSVREYAEKLKKNNFNIIKLKVNKNGLIDIAELKEKISEKTVLISIMFANNETGIIQPIKEIGKIAKEKNILFHSDIVQAYCKTQIDVQELNLDFASVSAHKIGATNNFGFLYTKSQKINPFIIGGGQEKGMRSGTSDIFGAMVLAKCIEETEKSISNIQILKNYFLKSLAEKNIDFEINGDHNNSLPNILNIYFKNIQAQRLITYLDINNIYISGGSACSSGNIKGSKIIADMFDEKRAEHSVRISLGFDTKKEYVNTVVEKIKILEEKIISRG